MNLEDYSLIVIKVGSAIIVDEKGKTRNNWMTSLARDISLLKERGIKVVLVSSGTVALGREILNAGDRELSLSEKQAAAACGQAILGSAWKHAFQTFEVRTAQILLTSQVTENRREFLNARNTLSALLEHGILPIVNENDTIATEGIRYGDNDRLAARVAQMSDAEALILFSDVNGLYTANPHENPNAKLIDMIEEITPEIEQMASGTTNNHGTGGMASKLEAAKMVTRSACHMILSNGRAEYPIQRLRDGGDYSFFKALPETLSARKQWITGSLNPAGEITVDAGAERALHRGSSLLFAGVTKIKGEFYKGDTLIVRNVDGHIIAKGLSNFDHYEAEPMVGKQSHEMQGKIGYQGSSEIIHRDNLVMEALVCSLDKPAASSAG